MNQQKANQVFRGWPELNMIYVTSDDRVFIRPEECTAHGKEIGDPTFTIWIPDDYWIKVTPKGRGFLYEVFANGMTPEGEKIGQRKSDRTYVACLVVDLSHPDHPPVPGYAKDAKGYAIINWFGRKGLIGKGDSRHLFGKPGVAVAYLMEEED